MEEKFKIVGYFPIWKMNKSSMIRYDVCTHIVYAFAFPDINTGELFVPNIAKAKEVTEAAHEKNIKMILSIGGWDNAGVSQKDLLKAVAVDGLKIQKMIESIEYVLKEMDFDGIDFNPGMVEEGEEDLEAILEMCKSIGKEVKAEGKLYTLSIFGNKDGNDVVTYEPPMASDEIEQLVDWYNILTYEIRKGVRGATLNFKIKEKISNEIKINKEKCVIGIPFYANVSFLAYQDDFRDLLIKEGENKSIFTCGREVYCVADRELRKNVNWALKNVQGLNIWEMTQDFKDIDKSLMSKIKECITIEEKQLF